MGKGLEQGVPGQYPGHHPGQEDSPQGSNRAEKALGSVSQIGGISFAPGSPAYQTQKPTCHTQDGHETSPLGRRIRVQKGIEQNPRPAGLKDKDNEIEVTESRVHFLDVPKR